MALQEEVFEPNTDLQWASFVQMYYSGDAILNKLEGDASRYFSGDQIVYGGGQAGTEVTGSGTKTGTVTTTKSDGYTTQTRQWSDGSKDVAVLTQNGEKIITSYDSKGNITYVYKEWWVKNNDGTYTKKVSDHQGERDEETVKVNSGRDFFDFLFGPENVREADTNRWDAVYGTGGIWEAWQRQLEWSIYGKDRYPNGLDGGVYIDKNGIPLVADPKWPGWEENGGTVKRNSIDFTVTLSSGNFQTDVHLVTAGAGSDLLHGSVGIDMFYAGGGNDTLYGYEGNDQLSGEEGNDYVDGGAGDDMLYGGNGDDTLLGGLGDDLIDDAIVGTTDGTSVFGNDYMLGGEGNDTIFGRLGNDTLDGGSGNDLIDAGEGDDLVYAGSGNDLVIGYTGHDTLSGGDGNDSLLGGEGNDSIAGDGGNDLLHGDAGNDSLLGGLGDDTLYGDGGNDVLSGGDGLDTLYGGEGNDMLSGDADNDLLAGGAECDTLYGGLGEDVLFGEDGDDILAGQDGHDSLYGGAGNDSLLGGAGNDLFIGGTGADTLNGGAGVDTVSYADATAGVSVDLARGTTAGGEATGDRLFDIEHVVGSRFDDVLRVSDDYGSFNTADYLAKNPDIQAYMTANKLGMDFAYHHWVYYGRFEGRAGGFDGYAKAAGGDWGSTFDAESYLAANPDIQAYMAENKLGMDFAYHHWINFGRDEGRAGGLKVSGAILDGGEGNDTITGGLYSDHLTGGVGNDVLAGNGGHDVVLGGSGNDSLSGGDGNDYLNGGAGQDTLYGGNDQDTLDGFDGDDRLFGEAGNDVLNGGRGHDGLDGGTGNDTLSGGEGNDTLCGGDGDDVLYGGVGHDVVSGGAGNDTLYGGTGHDTLFGGSGKDVFVFHAFNDAETPALPGTPAQVDVIKDFEVGDMIRIEGAVQVSSSLEHILSWKNKVTGEIKTQDYCPNSDYSSWDRLDMYNTKVTIGSATAGPVYWQIDLQGYAGKMQWDAASQSLIGVM